MKERAGSRADSRISLSAISFSPAIQVNHILD
jgi:hypothetical protein